MNTNQRLLWAHSAVSTVACFSISWGSRAQCPIQKTGIIVPSKLQVSFTMASNLTIRGHRPLPQALWTSELPYNSVLLQHVLNNRFTLRANPAVSKLLFQECEMLLYSLQTFWEVKVNLFPGKLGLSGLAGPFVFTLDHSPFWHSERNDGGDKPLVVEDGAQQPPRREVCDPRQGHFNADLQVSLLTYITQSNTVKMNITRNMFLKKKIMAWHTLNNMYIVLYNYSIEDI